MQLTLETDACLCWQADIVALQQQVLQMQEDDRRAARISEAAVMPLISSAQEARAEPANVQAALKAAAETYGDLTTPQVRL